MLSFLHFWNSYTTSAGREGHREREEKGRGRRRENGEWERVKENFGRRGRGMMESRE